MDNPKSAIERGLIKGALRRVFSRSDLRRIALNRAKINHYDILRPRVTKWAFCGDCGLILPAYLMEVDHVIPVIPVDKSLEDLSWDELIDRLWCDASNLVSMCKPCHKDKSAVENKLRKAFKKERNK